MQIEEAIDVIKNEIDDFVIGDYCVEICEQKELCKNGECRFSIAIDTLINYVKTMHKELDRLEGIEDNTAMLKYELEQKDKVIENMTNCIDEISEQLAREVGIEDFEFCDSRCADMDEFIECRECIKQYFYKKASEEDVTDGR